MSKFVAKRPSGADMARLLAPATTGHVPLVVPESSPAAPAAAPLPSPSRPAKPPPVVQVNFKCSEEMAGLLADEAEKVGSTRRFLARLLRDAGYPVPEVDVNPPDNRRRRLPR